MTKRGKSFAIFVTGTVFSIVIGIVFALYSKDFFESIVVVLAAEIVVMISALYSKVGELHDRLHDHVSEKLLHMSEKLHDMTLLAKSADYISSTQDEIYRERYRNVILELEDLSNGRYQLNSLSEVYDDDIRSMKQLRQRESLDSMCPVQGNSNDALRHFNNKFFMASMEAHYQAAKDGVSVRRIYIFEISETAKQDFVIDHFEKCAQRNCKIHYILLDDERFQDAKDLPRDFIIFGERKVSVGRVGQDSRVSGGDVYADQYSVERYRREYERLLRISEPYRPKDKKDEPHPDQASELSSTDRQIKDAEEGSVNHRPISPATRR